MTGSGAPAEGKLYHIRVMGNLDEKWADWFGGFVMASRPAGETLLTGRVADQAALHGILNKISGLDHPLQLAAQIECPCSAKRCPRHGHCQECTAHHAASGKLPFCFREKTRWDKHCAALARGR